MQEGYFFDLDTEQWSKASVVHERARYCPTVQLRFSKDFIQSVQITNNSSSSLTVSANLSLMNT